MKTYALPKDQVTYNYRYFLPYAPEWGSEALCDQRLEELLAFCAEAKVDAVQFFVNTLPGTYYMPAHNAQEQRHWAEWMRDKVRPALEAAHVSYQLNFQMLLGASPCNLDMRDEYPWEFLVNQYGDESLGCACPLGPKFLSAMGEMLRLWASTGPDVVWIDDDFRMHNHGLATPRGDCDFYCYCPTHLAAFAKATGKAYGREELVAEVLRPGPPTELRRQWLDFLGQTMTEAAAWVGKEIQGVSPRTRLALMTSCPDVHSVEGRDWKGLLDALSGPYTPMTRPMCGVYTGTAVPVKQNVCTYKYMSQSMDCLTQLYGAEGVEFGPELENTRFTTWCKSVANSQYVMTLSQLLGASQITLSLNDLDGSPIEQEPTTAPLLRDGKPALQALAALNLRNWRKRGLVFLNDLRSARKAQVEDNAKMQDLGLLRDWEDVLLQCGVPAHHASCAAAAASGEVVALEGYTAWSPSDSELLKLLSGSLLLDADAAAVLRQRGFGEHLGVVAGERLPFAAMAEKYRDGVLPGVSGRVPHRGFKWRQLELAGATLSSELIDGKNRHWPGSALFENALGGRVATYASVGDFSYGTFGNHLRLAWLHGVLDWLAHGAFPALPLVPHHALCVVRERQGETLLALANLGTDALGECAFALPAPRGLKTVQALGGDGSWLEAEHTTTGQGKLELSLSHRLNVFEWLVLRLQFN